MIKIIYTDGAVVVLDPDEPPTLEQMQGWVEGYIEPVPDQTGVADQVFVNEEGRIKDLPLNVPASNLLSQYLYGNAVLLTGRHVLT